MTNHYTSTGVIASNKNDTACHAQGQPWTAALAGHDVDPVKQQEEQQRLMLERFQQEVSMAAGAHTPDLQHIASHHSVVVS